MRDEDSLEQRLEALVCVAIEPVSTEELADVVGADAAEVLEALQELARQYEEERRGFVLSHLASGWVLATAPDMAPWVSRFASRGLTTRLSSAALETLAIIAYRQPISRSQISALRGVNVDGVTRLLEQRGYIEEHGRVAGPGQSILYGTTDHFLDRLGLSSLDQLPPIEQFLVPLSAADELADEGLPGAS